LSAASFYFYDLETWGADPKKDRIAQFAGVRTNLNLEPLAAADMAYCQLAPDYLPAPEAVLITGITPQKCQKVGLTEVEFIQRLHQQLAEPGTCVVGYNNIRFDDEMVRHTLFRNYIDPYAREWQHGNSRWDLIDVVRACYALRPDGIQWPLKDDGSPSFRLEDLCKANSIEHVQAHDASSDVYATIALAALIRSAQPRLFDYLYQHRQKQPLSALIDVAGLTPLLHVSSKFPALQGCCSWVVPLAYHPTNKNAVICFNLQQDPRFLLEMDVEEIRRRLYAKSIDLAADELRPALKLVHLNKSPVLAPAKTLSAARATELGIDRTSCLQHLEVIRQNQQTLSALFQEVYRQTDLPEQSQNPDYSLYQGFLSDHDRRLLPQVHSLSPQALALNPPVFQDDRLNSLMFRFRARNFPETLTHQELEQWQRFCKDKLQFGIEQPARTIDEFMLLLEHCVELKQDDAKAVAVLKQLFGYINDL